MNIVEYAKLKKILGSSGSVGLGGTEGLAYTLSENGEYYICSGIGTATDIGIVIASTHRGLPVKKIGAQAFEGNTSITKVTIPYGITTIEYDAFSGCTALTSIVIPDSVVEISWYVFNGCTALTSATIGSRVQRIGDYAFNGCLNLKTVTFANNGKNLAYMGKGVFSGCRSLHRSIPEGRIPVSATTAYIAFALPSGLTSLNFGTLSANGGAKEGISYTGMVGLVIPSNISTIADRAVYGCANLWYVKFEGTPDIINPRLFENCAKLTKIYVPWAEGTFADAENAWVTMGATIRYNGEC